MRPSPNHGTLRLPNDDYDDNDYCINILLTSHSGEICAALEVSCHVFGIPLGTEQSVQFITPNGFGGSGDDLAHLREYSLGADRYSDGTTGPVNYNTRQDHEQNLHHRSLCHRMKLHQAENRLRKQLGFMKEICTTDAIVAPRQLYQYEIYREAQQELHGVLIDLEKHTSESEWRTVLVRERQGGAREVHLVKGMNHDGETVAWCAA